MEASILRMVGRDIASHETLNFKVLVRGKEQATPRKAQSYDLGKVSIGEKGEAEVSERGPMQVKPFIAPPRKVTAAEAEADPAVIRIEVMSDSDYFFQYAYE